MHNIYILISIIIKYIITLYLHRKFGVVLGLTRPSCCQEPMIFWVHLKVHNGTKQSRYVYNLDIFKKININLLIRAIN